MASKEENINTLGILLCLEPAHKKDLNKLSAETLDYMRAMYSENALQSNIKMTDEHVNHSLPTVGPYVQVWHQGKFVEGRRENFVTNKNHEIEFITRDGNRFYVKAINMKWKYF